VNFFLVPIYLTYIKFLSSGRRSDILDHLSNRLVVVVVVVAAAAAAAACAGTHARTHNLCVRACVCGNGASDDIVKWLCRRLLVE